MTPLDAADGWGEWWPAPAKVNLMLRIVGRRSDGYHLLQTVFQFIDCADRLRFRPRRDGRVRRARAVPGLAEDSDLVVRAARLLQQDGACPLGVDIDLDKRLPMGAGLGGGSSDAATTLSALNRLWGLSRSVGRLAVLGLSLGADVPVFLHGRAAWAEGVGERLSLAYAAGALVPGNYPAGIGLHGRGVRRRPIDTKFAANHNI